MIRLFLTFNSELTVLEMKHEIKDRVMSHSKPVVGVLYNRTYGQVLYLSMSIALLTAYGFQKRSRP